MSKTLTRRVRVQNLAPGDVVRRDAFGTKTVLGLRRYVKRGTGDARIVKYDDGTASLFKANRLVDVVTVVDTTPAARPYSTLVQSFRSSDVAAVTA